MNRRAVLRALAAGCLAGLGALPAAGENYPSSVIRLIVPFPPGGLNDNVARAIQPELQRKLGQTIVIENKPGASGIIGADAVAKAKPDGYTLVVVASSYAVTPATNPNMPFDAAHDLAAVGLLVRDPLLFVAGPKSGAKSLADLVALARARPGTLTYATPGTDSQSHFVTALFGTRAGIKTLEVPYRGGAPAVLSLISGETDFAVLSEQLSGPQIAAGKLIPLASGGRTRSAHFPAVPTLAEAGFPGLEALQWVGMLAPAGTPEDVVATLNAALREVLSSPEVAARLDAQGVTAAPTSPQEFQALIAAEIAQWKDVAADAGLTPR